MDRADVLWQEWVKAMDRIKQLEAENERLRKELEKFKTLDGGTF